MTLKLEIGGVYRDAEGRKVSIENANSETYGEHQCFWGTRQDGVQVFYLRDGRPGSGTRSGIVSLWDSPAVSPQVEGDGWIPHVGNECPLQEAAKGDARLSNGTELPIACVVWWGPENNRYHRVVAYKLDTPAPAAVAPAPAVAPEAPRTVVKRIPVPGRYYGPSADQVERKHSPLDWNKPAAPFDPFNGFTVKRSGAVPEHSQGSGVSLSPDLAPSDALSLVRHAMASQGENQ